MKQLLLALIVAVPLFAQTPGDFALQLNVWLPGAGFVPVDGSQQRAALGSHVYVTVNLDQPPDTPGSVVEIDVPGVHEEVYPPDVCTNTKPVRCTIPASHWDTSIFVTTTLDEAGLRNVTARVIAPNDPNPANNQHTVPLEIVDTPSLVVNTMPYFWPLRTEPSQERQFSASVSNYDGQDARDVVLTLTLPDGGTFTGGLETTPPELSCTVDPATVVCTVPLLPNKGSIGVIAATKAPDRLTGGDFTLKATVTSDRPDFEPQDNTVAQSVPLVRHLLVTNTGDEGSGSLRQALLESQQLCGIQQPCTIDFRIPGTPADGRFVIQPLTELPEIRGTVNVDGSTQKAFGGDANPTGPEIELDGSLAAAGARGLVLGSGCDVHVRELAIRNFPAPGIESLRDRTYDYQQCEAGFAWPATTITHNHITGNARGVALTSGPAASVTDNVILGNRRAGVFIQAAGHIWLERNLIGGNGASGVFLDAALGTVAGNHILVNGEWGLARTNGGDIAIQRNSIHDNVHLAIDAGLDFQSPNRQPDTAEAPPNTPVLFSAHYDPVTNKTVVRGRLDSTSLDERTAFTIDLYASSRDGQAEQWIAQQAVANNAEFTIEADGDHRGKYITATHTRARRIFWDDTGYNTSEVSGGVVVP